jgi:hypothetical protein
MMPFYRAVIACVSVCWVLGSAVARGDAPAVDPCTLISQADVEQVIGKLKGPPTSRREEQARFCMYEFANEKDALELWVFPASGLERARKLHKDLLPVPGLGRDAFMRRNTGLQYLELFVKKGNVTLEVTMKEAPGDEEKVQTLAKKALTRL